MSHRLTIAVVAALAALLVARADSAHSAATKLPHRIVSLSPSATESLYAIGAGNSLKFPMDVGPGTIEPNFGGDGGLSNGNGLWDMFGDEFHVLAGRIKSGGATDVFIDDVRLRTGTLAPSVPVTKLDYSVAEHAINAFSKYK